MSFDLMVFVPDDAPTSNPKEFMAWYWKQTDWSEDYDYSEPSNCSGSLRSWLTDMLSDFPLMNGPVGSSIQLDDPNVTDYSISKSIIYAAFSWASADAAYERVLHLAKQHKLGFFDLTAESGGVWLPTSSGYEKVFTADELESEEDDYGLLVFDPRRRPRKKSHSINGSKAWKNSLTPRACWRSIPDCNHGSTALSQQTCQQLTIFRLGPPSS